MIELVLDASAILAMLRSEPGAEQVADVIDRACVSVINEAEVIGKLMWRGQTADEAWRTVSRLPYALIDVDRDICRRAGSWLLLTKPQGLSLADRCCLALAARRGVPAMTADTSWANVNVGVDIRLIAGRRRR